MKQALKYLFLTLTVGLLMISCKKGDIENNLGRKIELPSNNISDWLKHQSASVEKQTIKIENFSGELIQELDWGKSLTSKNQNIKIIPFKLTDDKGYLPIKKYLVVYYNEKNNITKANVYLINTKEKSNSEKFVIEPSFFELKTLPRGFSGTINKYDIYKKRIFSKSYLNGNLTETTGELVARVKKPDNSGGYLVDPNEDCNNGGSWTCIEWFWQTWVNGQLVNEEYLYTTCQCIGGTGGGGGTGGSSTSNCQNITLQQMHTLMSNITTETNYNISTAIGPIHDEGGFEMQRSNNPKWQFFKANFFLGYFTEYTAYFNGIVYKRNSSFDFWKWREIAFSTISRSSGSLPPCMAESISPSVSNPLISGDKKEASASISCTFVYTYTCLFGSEAATYNVSALETSFGAGN